MSAPSPSGPGRGPAYTRQLHVTWGDLDANGHMRNTAYLDRVAEVVMHFFTEHGFPVGEFARLGVGPVVQTEQLEYRREFLLMDTMSVRLAIQGLSEDAARFALLTEFFHQDGQSAARVRTTGGWLHRTARALVAPPERLAAVLRGAPRTGDFVQLPGLVRVELETSNPSPRPAACSPSP